jgi:hypothetical protein
VLVPGNSILIVPVDGFVILNSADGPNVKSTNPTESTLTDVFTVLDVTNDPASGAVAPIGAISNLT